MLIIDKALRERAGSGRPAMVGAKQTAKQMLRSILPRTVTNWWEKGYFGTYGEPEMHLVEVLCRRDQDAIDVGANYGGYVHFMRGHARRVIAYEPIPEFVELLRRKFARDVVVEPIALSDRVGDSRLCTPIVDGVAVTGCATLSSDAASAYDTHRDMEVRADRLDNVYKGLVGFIKIDVEGHEQAVLDGAVETIARCRPRILVEIEEHLSPGGLARAKGFFSGFGYRGYYAHGDQLENIEKFSPTEMQNPLNRVALTATLRERLHSTGYVNNFIFLPCDEPQATVDRMGKRLARM